MPYKDKLKKSEQMKLYMRKIRDKKYKLQDGLTTHNRLLALLITEFKERAALPKHIYEYRQVMKQMLKEYFKKKVIKIFNKTELIINSNKYI